MENKSSTTLSNLSYALFFCLMLFAKAIGLPDESIVYTIIMCTACIFFIFKLVLTDHSMFELILIISLLIISVVSYLLSKERGILFVTAVILGAKNVSIKRLFKYCAVIWTASFIILTFCTQFGIISDYCLVHDKGSLGYIVRYSFGYPHPNVLHISYLVLVSLLLYALDLNLKQLRNVSILLMILNVFVFIYSVSYTGLLIVTLYLVANYVLAYRKEKDQHWPVFDLLIRLIFPFCVLFSVFGPVLFKGKLYDLCDKLIHHRFVLSNYYLTNEKLTLFGHILQTPPDLNHSIDCSYVYLLVHCGIIPFVLICIGYMLLINHCVTNKEYKKLSIIMAFSIAGVTEPFMFNTSFKNISAVFIGEYLFISSKEILTSPSAYPFLKRNIQLLKIGDNVISTQKISNISSKITSMIRRGIDTLISHIRCILVISAAVTVISLALSWAFIIKPTSVLIPASCCPDGYPGDPTYITEESLSDTTYKTTRILSYSPRSEMVRFDGAIADLEYKRIIFRNCFWAFIATLILCDIVFNIKTSKSLQEERGNNS